MDLLIIVLLCLSILAVILGIFCECIYIHNHLPEEWHPKYWLSKKTTCVDFPDEPDTFLHKAGTYWNRPNSDREKEDRKLQQTMDELWGDI